MGLCRVLLGGLCAYPKHGVRGGSDAFSEVLDCFPDIAEVSFGVILVGDFAV